MLRFSSTHPGPGQISVGLPLTERDWVQFRDPQYWVVLHIGIREWTIPCVAQINKIPKSTTWLLLGMADFDCVHTCAAPPPHLVQKNRPYTIFPIFSVKSPLQCSTARPRFVIAGLCTCPYPAARRPRGLRTDGSSQTKPRLACLSNRVVTRHFPTSKYAGGLASCMSHTHS